MGGYLKGKVAIVTGSGHGIGRALIVAMAKEGARVVTNDVNPETAKATADGISSMGGEALAFPCDVSDFEATGKLVSTAVDKFGSIDILVNNAGTHAAHMVWKMTEEEWDHVIASHLKGTFNCTHHACAFMREQKWGRIINVTSPAWLGTVGDVNYSAAKAGIVGITRSVALDMSKYGVTCNCYLPVAMTDDGKGGMMDWPKLKEAFERMHQSGLVSETEYQRTMNMPGPETVHPLIIYLCTEEAVGINGQIFGIYGNRIGIYSQPKEVRSIVKDSQALWTVDELKESVPSLLKEE